MSVDGANESKGGHVLSREALEFAPGLLSIQESPPARLPRAVLYSVGWLFFILLAWAFFGRLDIVASAEGRLVPRSYLKIVQPAEAGVIQEILVGMGDTVTAGQVLMRMDAEMTEADARTVDSELAIKSLQLRRIDAELVGVAMVKHEGDPPTLFEQVAAQYEARRQSYLDSLARESAALDKARHDLRSAREVLEKLRKVVPAYRKSAEAYRKLAGEGHVSSLAADEKALGIIEKEQDLRAQESMVESLGANITASEKRLAQITSSYQSELRNERIEVESRYRMLREEAAKLSHKVGLMELRAPYDGTVKDLATHTPGTVVSPGTVLMTIVPTGDPLRVEVLVKNEDVGFVRVGQEAKIKLSAYPFQKYGMVDGRVVHVGPDSTEGGAGGAGEQGAAPRFKALIDPMTQYLATDGRKMRLVAGMQAVVEIHQGSRTVMEYLLSPVNKAWQEAGRER